jgi:co-chaperonin GroES (HSP10)
MKTKRGKSKNDKAAMQVAAEIRALGYVVPGSKLLIMRDQPMEQETAGGIILREEAQARPLKGTIIALGQGIMKCPEDYDLDGIDVLMRATFSKFEGHKESIALLDGDVVEVEFLTAADLYLVWIDGGVEESETGSMEGVADGALGDGFDV